MKTECTGNSFGFQPLFRRDVVAQFNGGKITSDAGGLLLRETERATGIIRQFADCFTDHRSPVFIEHTVNELISQRVYGLALGYEDLNDHDQLRYDPLLAVMVGKRDPTALKAEIVDELEMAKRQYHETGCAARVFKDFKYQTLKSWSQRRRVIAKAEHLRKGANPRFVVTSLAKTQFDAREVYEQQYCARGDMENRIKEQQLQLFSDRTSCSTMRANELRMWFSAVAYTLTIALRRLGLQNTDLQKAQPETIRLKLFKIGAQIRVTVRKVWIALAESYPYQHLFEAAWANLKSAADSLFNQARSPRPG